MHMRKLGKSNLEVSALGFGCMGLSFGYGPPVGQADGDRRSSGRPSISASLSSTRPRSMAPSRTKSWSAKRSRPSATGW